MRKKARTPTPVHKPEILVFRGYETRPPGPCHAARSCDTRTGVGDEEGQLQQQGWQRFSRLELQRGHFWSLRGLYLRSARGPVAPQHQFSMRFRSDARNKWPHLELGLVCVPPVWSWVWCAYPQSNVANCFLQHSHDWISADTYPQKSRVVARGSLSGLRKIRARGLA